MILYIKVEDVNDLMDDGFTSIQVERSSEADGPYTLQTTLTLVEDQVIYTWEDTTGNPLLFYRYRFYTSVGPTATPYTNPFQPPQSNRVSILHQALQDYDAGAVYVAAAGSTTTTVKTDDYRFKNGGSANKGKGGWIRVASGLYIDARTNISGTDPVTGTFTVTPALLNGIAATDLFEHHWLANPDQWFRAINRGLARYWYLDRVPIVGDGNPEQNLNYLTWLQNKKQVMGVWYNPVPSGVEYPFSWWNVRQENGYIILMTSPTLSVADTVYLEAVRRMDPLLTDDSVLAPSCNIELAAALAYDEVLAWLLRPGGTSSTQDRSVWALARQQHRGRIKTLYSLYGPSPRVQQPTLAQPSLVMTPWVSR